MAPQLLNGTVSSHSTQVPVVFELVHGGTVNFQWDSLFIVELSAAAALSSSSCWASCTNSAGHSDCTHAICSCGRSQDCRIVGFVGSYVADMYTVILGL